MITRRFFIGGAFSALALGPKRIFAEAMSEGSGRPDLVFGVISDVHFALAKGGKSYLSCYTGDVFRKTLARFRDAGVDAVVIAGDIAHSGLASEMAEAARVWFEIFPGDRAPDGRKVERIFVTGNHENGIARAKRVYPDGKGIWEPELLRCEDGPLAADYRKWWDRIWHEEWKNSFVKEVKGYRFAGFNWVVGDCRGREEKFNPEIADWYAANGRSFDPSRPFFHIQHPHPKGTVHGNLVWGQDDGISTKALMAHPNAIAFSGHSHTSLTDERSVWQGGFTSIGCGTLRNVSIKVPGCGSLPYSSENDYTPVGQPPEIEAGKAMTVPDLFACKQEQLVRVYGDHIRLSRREANSGESYGDDILLPLPAAERRPFDFKMREAQAMAPEFPAGAKLRIRRKDGRVRGTAEERNRKVKVWEIAIPRADAVRNVRAAAYQVEINGDDGSKLELEVFDESFRFPANGARGKASAVCLVDCARIPAKSFSVCVRAVSCWGRRSASITGKV